MKRLLIIVTVLSFLGSCTIFNKPAAEENTVGQLQSLPSGLSYIIHQAGEGEEADSGDVVKVHYTGKLTNDTVFDSSVDRGEPIQFKLGVGQVIKGWDEGISKLRVGDKATFTIPPHLGYGERELGSIPANSVLIFDVELMGVIKEAKPYEIDGIAPMELASGLKIYKLNEMPEAQKAKGGDRVSVHYSGYLSDGSKFDSSVDRGEPISFQLGVGQVIPGWEEGIATLRIGEKARFVIPPDLAYGEQGRPPVIPANATLTFDVELVNIQ